MMAQPDHRRRIVGWVAAAMWVTCAAGCVDFGGPHPEPPAVPAPNAGFGGSPIGGSAAGASGFGDATGGVGVPAAGASGAAGSPVAGGAAGGPNASPTADAAAEDLDAGVDGGCTDNEDDAGCELR